MQGIKKKHIGMKIWISGNFKLYQSANPLKWFAKDKNARGSFREWYGDVVLEKQEVMIVDIDKFQDKERDIFLYLKN